MYLVDGQKNHDISVRDRSFQYGDGVFTTILTRNGTLVRWQDHLARLKRGLFRLAIPEPDWPNVELWLAQVMSTEPLAGIKLHISRGQGGRGYSPTGCDAPMVTVSSFAFPAHYQNWYQTGVELGICQQQLGLNPMLAGIKHNNRLEQVMLKAEMEQQGVVDGVVCDLNQHVVETTMANIFWRRGDVLYTPKIEQAGVEGVARNFVVNHAEQFGHQVKVGSFSLQDLLCADEVYLTNALIGVAPVRKIAHHAFSFGPLAEQLRKSYMSC